MQILPPFEILSKLVLGKRKKEALTQEALADLAGVTVKLVRAIEKGRQNVQLDGAWRVFTALGLTHDLESWVEEQELIRIGKERGSALSGLLPEASAPTSSNVLHAIANSREFRPGLIGYQGPRSSSAQASAEDRVSGILGLADQRPTKRTRGKG